MEDWPELKRLPMQILYHDVTVSQKTSPSMYYYFRNSRLDIFYKKGVLKNFAKFTGKHLYQSLLFNKVAGLSLILCQ